MKDYYVILQVSRYVHTLPPSLPPSLPLRTKCTRSHTSSLNQPPTSSFRPSLSPSTSYSSQYLPSYSSVPPFFLPPSPFHRSASIQDIKMAYKNFALKLHPDVTGKEGRAEGREGGRE